VTWGYLKVHFAKTKMAKNMFGRLLDKKLFNQEK